MSIVGEQVEGDQLAGTAIPNRLKRLADVFRGKPRFVAPRVHVDPPGFPDPETEVAVIGDIHGRLDLLTRLIEKLSAKAPAATLVFVGDYIDRGPSSRGVLNLLRSMGAGSVYLAGNHEVMALDFLDQPQKYGNRWLRNGGIETLASFGIQLAENADPDDMVQARDAFQAAISDGTEAWLRARPLTWKTGNLLVTHAGPDPKLPIDQQEDQSFLWGHPRFLRDARTDGVWVAHGHWIRDRPIHASGRISVDTGAWHSGHLTGAIIAPGGAVRFLQT